MYPLEHFFVMNGASHKGGQADCLRHEQGDSIYLAVFILVSRVFIWEIVPWRCEDLLMPS
jgi:hypothetical protein